jgi:predicted Zn-dependent protease
VATDGQGASDTREYFFSLTDAIRELLGGREVFTCYLLAEESSFVRFNQARVGQAGQVRQRQIDLDLIDGRQHARGRLTICGDRQADWPRVVRLVDELRQIARACPEDPFLSFNTKATDSSERSDDGALPGSDEVVELLVDEARACDLVGIFASGAVHRGFASSLGQRNWHTANSFNLDWSQFGDGGRAVKGAYAGIEWDAEVLQRKLAAAREDLAVLAQPSHTVKPGKYRVYLAPAAMQELMAILSWGGFGLRDKMTRVSPLLRLHEGEAALAACVDLAENIAVGTAPHFERSGFPRPERIPLVTAGRSSGCLVSPRSAVEFGVDTNGADEGEAPSSLDLAGGQIDAERVAQEVHRGLIISNLWYLNFSDRIACRTTGMTRYATTWVDGGRVQGPVDPMRFDDSVYRILGSNLVGFTRQRDWIMDPDTYEWRSLRTARLPGALVENFTLTL